MDLISVPEVLDSYNYLYKYEVVYEESEKSELQWKQVNSDADAYEMYNDYAFRHGFSIRKGKVRYVGSSSVWRGRNYVCSNAGLKDTSSKVPRKYSKLDYRTCCEAYIDFVIDEKGVWTAVKHNMDHNHAMIPVEKRYLLRSQRKIQGEHLKFIRTMKASGVRVTDSLRALRKEVGGSPNLCYTVTDVYNTLAIEKAGRLEGGDCNALIKSFAARQAKESDFYYEFEVDGNHALCSVFWRDGRMRRDYEAFGDLMVFDTTYRTNKYGMICAPFVGMNHHCNNVMFGMSFVLDEKTSSFVWLFEAFMRSMGGCRDPITLMTDQAPSIAATIRQIFPSTRHRLCTWHLGENSKTNIGGLRILKGFPEVFDFFLKMMTKYKCSENDWLNHLYDIKEKWCPAYSKDYFSGGVLSSQRSETTNHSASNRLNKTDGLSDFYSTFIDVISEWRSKESKQDFRFLRGNHHLAVANVRLLIHAREIYTISVYVVFEDQFAKGIACCQERKHEDDETICYYVWRPNKDIIRHEVTYEKFTFNIN
ncbi:protein FAR1-RELATED SEQUENCE 5-like [Chenopodium quinoa]|uniref:protein FAR1-RELATED SEQUENCE 5-like n=1 Tax=Chenopodium quinoa TaxID=63459 RepID=UPI000B788B35|nr:protein FAR1-RELATED SEQUENCE 5-like [Chenopodium quinoa]